MDGWMDKHRSSKSRDVKNGKTRGGEKKNQNKRKVTGTGKT